MIFERNDIKPAILRPAMYTGPQGDRNYTDYISDAVVAYLNEKLKLKRLNSHDN